ncbi:MULTISPECIES: response regulator transcription factor [Bacillus]|uniref:response regulator transcription factor n=1 Tax=Bacillus TaxID=1386 RepID=UPI001CD40E21|nr:MULTISPECIES: response regulator transcription factor [Bacillus]MCA1035478.1 response regulator transcription factor [Bacillus infantis]MDT0160907.1 response regulator transcription factor [Bacillus sp. AG4(2022)]
MIRIVLGEDQRLLLGALASLLELEEDIEVAAQGENGRQTLELVKKHQPDVLIVDIEMPLMTGLEVAEALKEAGSSCKVIILTTFARPGYFQRAIAAGVGGYLLKDTPSRDLAEAVRRVHAGNRMISPELSLAMWEEKSPLTPRETEILESAAAGHTMAQIASQLYLSHGTVRNYMSEIIGKLGAANRFEAVNQAKAKGWIK